MKKGFIPTLALLISFASLNTCYAWAVQRSGFDQIFTAPASSRDDCFNTIRNIIAPQIRQIQALKDDGSPLGRARILNDSSGYAASSQECKLTILAEGRGDVLNEIDERVRSFMLEHAPTLINLN